MDDREEQALDATSAMLLEMHRVIEETVEHALKKIDHPEDVVVTYPPVADVTLTQEEKIALEQLELSPELSNALRKMITDAVSFPLFHLFSLVDGVTEPGFYKDLWLGLNISPKTLNDEESDSAFLHDEFYRTYHTWNKMKQEN